MQQIKISYKLKEKQLETLRKLYDGRDCISVLPTYYGKSVIFQLLPWIYQYKQQSAHPLIAIIVSPLNSLFQDQVISLASRGINACYLNIEGDGAQTYKLVSGNGDDFIDEDSSCQVHAPKFVSLEDLRIGTYNLVNAHPETLLQNKTIANLLRTKVYRERVCAIVIDEVHMISEWGGDFRTTFSKLSEIICLFPLQRTVHLALTATSTKDSIGELAAALQLDDLCIVSTNPDRPNIYIKVCHSSSHMSRYDRIDDNVTPLAQELPEELEEFPVTIVYIGNLDSVEYCYELVSSIMKEKQYMPRNDTIPENRIFAQYHRQYTKKMKDFIVGELRKDEPKVRLIFATVALGMGLDAPNVRRIINLQPPTTVEKYMQEIGRAGRKSQSACAKYTTI